MGRRRACSGRSRARLALGACLAVVWLIGSAAGLLAADARLEPFFGAYVGIADVQDLETGEAQHRDMDIVIKPYGENGFDLHWVNVTRVDGRRDVPGVERRVQSVLFEPADGQDFYVEAQESSPFREREATLPMRGDPIRWAAIDGDRLQVFSFVVMDDGRYELQIYDRILTEQGMDIAFQRLVDGRLVKRITGTAVRAEVKAAEG